ncbi:o-succinylbenzoate synthase [Halomonas dongshanensis]|uniref:o-succinylbenzoate synthase n=1 Tax=Halomonas dongshanensis TaxID=2890835 RepID=A0ABT2EI31_9GAMM|nr:o-succinylbenzoate synthase [Halomonas dongshanensis]MCS2610998.1 o-succinylbenzoate synthase [Halomonas dongshanensis]
MTLALYRYALPLRSPLVLAGQRLEHREGLLVEINGRWGEIAPLPGFSRESLAAAETECRRCLDQLAALGHCKPTLPSVAFGLDCAQRQWPPSAHPLVKPYPLWQGTPQELIERLSTIEPGSLSRLKLKVARYPLDDEYRLIQTLATHLPPGALVLDANRGWSKSQALAFCSRLPEGLVAYIEEPCETFAASLAVASATGLSLGLDETLARNEPWHAHPRVGALIIKPTLIGTLARCEALVAKARLHGMAIVVSSSFESDVGLGHLARLAAEWAPDIAPGLDTRHHLVGGLLSDDSQTRDSQIVRERLRCCYQVETRI